MASPTGRFRDQVVVVAGATGGLGSAVARAFAAEGAVVVGGGRDQAALAALAPDVALVMSLDLTKPLSVEVFAAAVRDRFGRVDGLVHCAGVGRFAAWDEGDLRELERLLDVNLVGPARLTRALAPPMLAAGQGFVAFVASAAGLSGIAGEADYAASKHALVGYARSLRKEFAPRNVSVIVICPALIRTDFFARAGHPARLDAHRGQVRAPAEVAAALLDAVARGEGGELLLSPGAGLRLLAERLGPLFGRILKPRRRA